MSKYMSIESDECAICKDPLKDHKTSELDCNHIFHNKCIKKSLTCPYCRGRNKYSLVRQNRNEIATRNVTHDDDDNDQSFVTKVISYIHDNSTGTSFIAIGLMQWLIYKHF